MWSAYRGKPRMVRAHAHYVGFVSRDEVHAAGMRATFQRPVRLWLAIERTQSVVAPRGETRSECKRFRS